MKLSEFTVTKEEIKTLLKYCLYNEKDIPALEQFNDDESDNNSIHWFTLIVSVMIWTVLCLPLLYFGWKTFAISYLLFSLIYVASRKWLTFNFLWYFLNKFGAQYRNFINLTFTFYEDYFSYDKVTDLFEINYRDICRIDQFEGNLIIHTDCHIKGIFVIPQRERNNFQEEISILLKMANNNEGLTLC